MFRRRAGRREEAAGPAHVAGPLLDALGRALAATMQAAPKLAATEVGRVLASADDAELRAGGLAVLDLLGRDKSAMAEILAEGAASSSGVALRQRLEEMLAFVDRRKPAWTPEEARAALRMARPRMLGWQTLAGLRFAISVAEVAASSSGVGTITEELVRAREIVDGPGLPGPERVALRRRLTVLLTAGEGWEAMLTDGDAWGPAVRARLRSAEAADLSGLLQHLGKAGATPSARWRTATPARLHLPGAGDAVRILLTEVAAHERGTRLVEGYGQTYVYPADLLDAPNAEIARGAIWAAATLDEEWVVPTLRDTALFCGTSAAGGGDARGEKLANACAGALGTIEGDAAVTALAALQARIKNRSIRKRVDAALADIAARGGLAPSQLLKRTVPPSPSTSTAGRPPSWATTWPS